MNSIYQADETLLRSLVCQVIKHLFVCPSKAPVIVHVCKYYVG